MQATRVIRPKAAAETLGISRATLYRLVRAGALPPPLRISAGCSGWPEHVIADYIEARRAAGGGA